MTDDIKFWLEVFKICLTSAVVVIGWIVVYKLQRKSAADQELRKELKAKLDGIHEDIKQLRADCISYYVTQEPKPDLPVAIRVLADDIRENSISLSRAIMDQNSVGNVYDILADLVNNATGGNFETKKRTPMSPHDPKLNAVFFVGAKLTSVLNRAYQDRYQVPR
jgi:hypothetical protein